MIDGAIARNTGTVSKFGAKLDTVSDFVFMCICSFKFLPLMYIPIWLWVRITLITLIKLFDIAFVLIRKKKLLSIHSVSNKITGFALFLLPLSLTFIEAAYSVGTICIIATVAVIQEIYFIAKGQELL